jgi:hypothetical protein
MTFFTSDGRRTPSNNFRVFGDSRQHYYQLKQPVTNYREILSNSVEFGNVPPEISANDFKVACEKLKEEISFNPNFTNLLNGVHVPFICNKNESVRDLGKDLVEFDLLNYQKLFNKIHPEYHFKATLQGNSELPGNIELDSRSRYDEFLDACYAGVVIGWYFPQALQEFDVESQRQQMLELPRVKNICLSGGIDILAALIGSPNLLISEDFYAPILCLSSYVHSDPRLVLLMKSYGPHMEFWCMSQMLTKETTQVSEQWAGGITFYHIL